MKTFEELYKNFQQDNKIKDIWLEAKKESTKTKKISLTTCLVLDIIILVLIAISNIGFKLFFLMPLIVGILILDFIIYFCINVLFKKNNHKYYAEFKESIIKELIRNFYTNLEYFPNKQMPERIYNEAKYEFYDIYRANDYIEAMLDNKYFVSMADVKTKKQHKDSDGHEHYITIFSGLFEKINIDKSINSELKIAPNHSYLFSKKRLEMDSGEFEKYFDVSATNQIIGMQLLTADIMEDLVEFKNNTNIWYDIKIINDIIYLRFHCGEMFEPARLKQGVLDKETLRKYFYMLNFTYNLSNKLIKIIRETEI